MKEKGTIPREICTSAAHCFQQKGFLLHSILSISRSSVFSQLLTFNIKSNHVAPVSRPIQKEHQPHPRPISPVLFPLPHILSFFFFVTFLSLRLQCLEYNIYPSSSYTLLEILSDKE